MQVLHRCIPGREQESTWWKEGPVQEWETLLFKHYRRFQRLYPVTHVRLHNSSEYWDMVAMVRREIAEFGFYANL